MNNELVRIFNRFEKAEKPEDIFGKLSGTPEEKKKELKKSYRYLVKATHPDKYEVHDDKEMATRCFQSLTEWFTKALEKIDLGSYGDGKVYTESPPAGKPTIITTSKRSYKINGIFKEEEIYNVYPSSYSDSDGKLKRANLNIVRDPIDNSLALNEARVLKILLNGKGSAKYRAYIPELLENFNFSDGSKVRNVNVFSLSENQKWYSLTEVRDKYKYGVDPKDMAWIFRRLLVALDFAHLNGVIHGAVVPDNILILPEQHGLMLKNWMYALEIGSSGEHLHVIPKYEKWYPKEVLEKETVMLGSDVFMAAKNMINILGGDAETGYLPTTVPKPIVSFLKGSTLPGKGQHSIEAWELLREFDEILDRLWGPRKYHPFSMK